MFFLLFKKVFIIFYKKRSSFLLSAQDIRVTGISDGEDTGAEKLTASSTKIDVVTVVVVNTSLGQHSVVFDLGLAERGAVTGDDDQLGYKLTKFALANLVGGRSLPKKYLEKTDCKK
jgi:hypothetical protein